MNREKMWVNIRDSFWFLPALYSAISILMVILTSALDVWVVPKIEESLPKVFFTEKSVAQTLYGSLITSILTMTTISFSTIMVVLTTYTTQFSPRTLQDFMRSRVTQHVLGVYSFGFVFSLINLLLLGSEKSQGLLSPFITVFISIVCLAFFIIFIHHSSRFVQVNNLIGKIRTDTSDVIAKTFDEKDYHENVEWNPAEIDQYKEREPSVITASESGYLQGIQIDGLLRAAKQQDLLLEATFQVGSYIQKGVPLFYYWEKGEDAESPDDCLDYLLIGNERTDIQDIEFSIQKLVEIAVKAISPSINDPHTAVNCINRIGSLLSELAEVHKPIRYYADQDNHLRLIMEPKEFSDYLYKSFYQIRIYGKQDLTVMNGVLEALHNIAIVHKGTVKEDTWRFGKYMIESVDTNELNELDYERFYNHAKRLADECEEEMTLPPL
ncbi:DUF2254 domain-containing protein [Halobacillus litoralis]|uniref:DUF2254 domain-containing protein n=1 Tax=Halobacillus litoralis TaxID=45668 RepID=UPI001CD3FBEE|nr:DUF2254 domain-containing protein [Halobacillus litoralis]MCA0972603.1 DUF2254 domain-containing protein [Halobacillus litoralis]